MTLENLVIPFVFVELTILIVFFFSLYNPLKKKENKLIDKQKLTKIKKYWLGESLRYIKSFLITMFTLFIFSAILLIINKIILEESIEMIYLAILILGAYYIVIMGLLFWLYINNYRNIESICEANSLGQILKILKIKKKYLSKIKKIILTAEKGGEKENMLLSWILDTIDIKDKRIKN